MTFEARKAKLFALQQSIGTLCNALFAFLIKHIPKLNLNFQMCGWFFFLFQYYVVELVFSEHVTALYHAPTDIACEGY